MLQEPSDEQMEVIKAIGVTNVVVNSVAGSGKTTTGLQIALKHPSCNVLLLTYNASLKAETRLKIQKFGINNMEAHSFHAFCYKYYVPCTNDKEIQNLLTKKIKPKKEIRFDIIIADETQDMTFLLLNYY